MKIGIDVSQIVYRGSGIATYTENLVRNLLKIDKKNEYILFGSSLRQKHIFNEFVNQFQFNSGTYYTKPKLKFFNFPPTFLNLLWNKLHILPVETLIDKVDIFHTSDWLEPPSKAKKVTTIHDLVVYKYPQTLDPKIVATQKRKLEWVKKESDTIIAVSESTKRDIVEILGITPERVTVIYEAADENFNSNLKTQISKLKEVKEKYGIKGDYILSVGTLEPRKNIKRLIEAFSSVINHQSLIINLVIVGNIGWREEIEPVEGVIFAGFVPKEDLPYLYAGAEVFVYPSLYEGFGLPVLEAMACGTPIVCSNTSSLPEVGGEAAVYVNPESVESIAVGIKEILDYSEKEREEVVKKGLKQDQKFSWEKTARETLNVYKQVCS